MSVLLFQVGTFGTPQADAHRVGNMAECVKVKVKAEIMSITIDKWKGKSKTYFDPPRLALYDQYGEVEIAYSFWEPDHNGKGQGGKVDGVIELSNWSLSKSKTIPYKGSNAKDSYSFPKHTVLLHDTCWADVDNLVATMAVQELDDGESYKKAWYSTSVKKWWTGTFVETALTTVVDKIAKGPVGTVLTLPKSIYDATHITKNDFLGANSIVYDLEELDTKKYYYYNLKTKGDSGDTTIKFRVVILEDPDKQAGLSLPSDDSSAAISDTIPDWFKNNAKWWKDGLISDSDIINALETLIIQDVIPLDKFLKSPGLEHSAGVSKGGTFVIPSYQKDVFGFWSEGAVSDGEIVNSIGHLMSQGIINSEKIQTEISQRQAKSGPPIESYSAFDDDNAKQILQHESNIFIANNLALEQILEIQNFLTSSLDDSTEDAWMQYSENKNQDYMNNAVELEQKLNDMKGDSVLTLQQAKKNLRLQLMHFMMWQRTLALMFLC